MSTHKKAPAPQALVYSKQALWAGAVGLFWLLCIFVALSSLRFLVAPMSDVMGHITHYLTSAPVALYAHILGGPLALALAPFQLWQALRRRRRILHRIIGYIYVTAVLFAGIGALVMLPDFLGTGFAATGFACMALCWIGFTLRGVWLAWIGDHIAHRRFMLRSVTVTFSAVTLRLMMMPLMIKGWTVLETYQVTAWGAWVPTLIAVEIWLAWQARRVSRHTVNKPSLLR